MSIKCFICSRRCDDKHHVYEIYDICEQCYSKHNVYEDHLNYYCLVCKKETNTKLCCNCNTHICTCAIRQSKLYKKICEIIENKDIAQREENRKKKAELYKRKNEVEMLLKTINDEISNHF